MKELIRKFLLETITKNKVVCDVCGWSWDLDDGGDDKYVCHKCGNDNTPKKSISNFDKYVNQLGVGLDDKFLEDIKKYVKSLIKEKNYTVKFLNSCSTGFSGVRTKNQVIICSPTSMSSLGDFIYTLFHELRHEEQITNLKMKNPFVDMDLEDFEKLSEHYWNMEMDADKEAKQSIARMVMKLEIPIEKAKKYFKLSSHIENYQMSSNMVKSTLKFLINDIEKMKKNGIEFEDLQDHPIVKRHLDTLEDFI